jgi:hypothetical protein
MNLQQASFTHETALRVIANVNTAENSIQVEQHIQVFYGMISEIIVGLNQLPDVFIDSFVMEEPQELADIILEVQEKMIDLIEIVKSKPVAFYCTFLHPKKKALDLLTAELERIIFYIIIEDKTAYVLYLDSNNLEMNNKCLDVIVETVTNLGGLGIDIYYQSVHHVFICENVELFLGVCARLYVAYAQ